MHKNYLHSSIFSDFISNYIRIRRDADILFDNPCVPVIPF